MGGPRGVGERLADRKQGELEPVYEQCKPGEYEQGTPGEAGQLGQRCLQDRELEYNDQQDDRREVPHA